MQNISALKIQKILNKVIKTNFKFFLQKAFYSLHPNVRFSHNWHIDLIAEYLTALENRQITRLIINIPPRYLKSFCISVAWPAWLLGRDPSRKIMVASHSMALAKKFSQDSKLIMTENWYQNIFQTQLSSKQNTKEKFCTTNHGFRMACSVGSNITGEGGDYLIVDDPITPLQALSEKKRETVNDWFSNTFSTRLNDKKNGVIILVMQRLHPWDLSGYLFKKDNWEVLKIPAVSEVAQKIRFNNFHYIRKKGELLCEAREGRKEIANIKKELGTYAFSAQYQQEPIDIQNGLIKRKWFMRYTKLPDFIAVYQSWDTAIKIGVKNDYSVCTTWGVTNTGYHLLDVFRERLAYPDLKQMVVEKYNQYKPTGVIIEDKASGQQLIQDINNDNRMPIIKFLPKKQKLIRFLLMTTIIEAGKIHLPLDAAWLSDFESEVFSLPNSTHDDQADSMAQFLMWHQERMQKGTAKFRIRRLS
jgi:predicted phage terminase large subunit-like protein